MKFPRLTTVMLVLAWIVRANVTTCASAAEPPPVGNPSSPQESLRQFVVEPGLKVELVASEPGIVDPVAIRFDEDGRLWVVEMRDYPTALEGGPRSRISILEDRDGDGFFESATVFADGLQYATGVQPWKGGAFVTLSGKVVYMKDTDGDGKADENTTWYTGFTEKNTQLRANHPQLALDNHIYVANGLRGGTIVNARDPHSAPLSISGMDFRFDPISGACDAVSGVGQFGLTFDDFGNRFVCSNRNPAIHIVLEDRLLKKNPLFAAPSVVHDVAKAAEQSRVFPIGRSWTTSNLHAGQFTAACGLDIYRGDALPPEFRGNLFVCEPTGHLVHREVMRPMGVTFESSPAHEGVEFLASRDSWCSPVNLDVGPDGALYVVDMYRAVIEHPDWMPDELRHRPDLRYGNDRGRIYRIVPQDFQRPPAPRPSKQSGAALVAYLGNPNTWWRETAARLLLERHDTGIGPQLREIAQRDGSPNARVRALWLLNSLGLLDDELLLEMLGNRDPRIVEQAIILSDPRIAKSSALHDTISKLADSDDPRVRFQALLTAMPLPSAPRTAADSWEQDAMLIAAGNKGGTVLARMLRNPAALSANLTEPRRFVADLARLAAASSNNEQIALAVDSLLANPQFGTACLTDVFSEAMRRGSSFADVRSRLASGSQHKLDRALQDARRDATDARQQVTARCDAIDLLACTDNSTPILLPLAVNDPQQPIRLRAIAALARSSDLKPWQQVLASYTNATPALKGAILDGSLSSGPRTSLLLDEVAAGSIQPRQLDTNHVSRLLNHRDQAIQSRARKIFAASIPSDRQRALAEYQPVLTLKADPRRGREVFAKQCTTCHRIGDIGVVVAPDISDSREKSPAQLLTDIIQPNRAIDANYFSYTVITTDGVAHTGILAAETSTSVTLREPEGKSVSFRRDEIDELSSNGVSLMPEGLERLIPPQDMADLISFIKNWRYLDQSPPIQVPAK
jgi:putative membrane-bound dehydrogenase-like protein